MYIKIVLENIFALSRFSLNLGKVWLAKHTYIISVFCVMTEFLEVESITDGESMAAFIHFSLTTGWVRSCNKSLGWSSLKQCWWLISLVNNCVPIHDSIPCSVIFKLLPVPWFFFQLWISSCCTFVLTVYSASCITYSILSPAWVLARTFLVEWSLLICWSQLSALIWRSVSVGTCVSDQSRACVFASQSSDETLAALTGAQPEAPCVVQAIVVQV